MKDEKGHGSEARGSESLHRKSSHVKQLERLGLAGRGGNNTLAAELRAAAPRMQIPPPGPGDKLRATRADESFVGNAQAAMALAQGGAKSAPVETHPAMDGGSRNAQGYRTTGTAYEGPRMLLNDPGSFKRNWKSKDYGS